MPIPFRRVVVMATLIAVPPMSACAGASQRLPGSDTTAAAATITAADMGREIRVLAHDSMAGRDTPSPELEAAAAYLERRFRVLGLEPAGDGGTFIHRYPLELVRLVPESTHVAVKGHETPGRYARDYFMVPAPEPVEGTAVYDGVAGEAGAAADGAGRIHIFELPGADPGPAWNDRIGSALQATLAVGGTGLILILDPELPRYRISELAWIMAQQRTPIPVVWLTDPMARALRASAGASLDARRQADDPAALEGATLGIRSRVAADRPMPPNVVAMLPGSDPGLRDTYVALTAHFDHIGVGAPDASGDSIFNGADDNAAGTAALLEVAEAFARLPRAPARSVLFIAVSGEEKGLLGARAFVADPPGIEIGRVVANVNFDIIGGGALDSVAAAGQDHSTLGSVLARVLEHNPDVGLSLAPDPDGARARLLTRSDQLAFIERGIPSVFLLGGGRYGAHHTPSDEADRVDSEKAARVARLGFYLAHAVASSVEAPAWTETGWADVRGILEGGQP